MNTKTQGTTDQVIDTEVRAQELAKAYAQAANLYNDVFYSIQDKLERMEKLEAEMEEIKNQMRDELEPGSYEGFRVNKPGMYPDLEQAKGMLSERSLKALRPDTIDRKKLKALFPNVYSKTLKPGTSAIVIK